MVMSKWRHNAVTFFDITITGLDSLACGCKSFLKRNLLRQAEYVVVVAIRDARQLCGIDWEASSTKVRKYPGMDRTRALERPAPLIYSKLLKTIKLLFIIVSR